MGIFLECIWNPIYDSESDNDECKLVDEELKKIELNPYLSSDLKKNMKDNVLKEHNCKMQN